MGIIQRQSIKFSLVNLVATLIGVVSIMYIYPKDDELYGYANMLVSMAYLLLPFASLGITGVVVRFFREFKDDANNRGFLSLVLFISLVSNLIFVLAFYLFKGQFYAFVDIFGNSQVLEQNETVILLIVILISLSSIFISFASNLKRIVIPSLIQTFSYKIYLPIIFLICYSGYISWKSFSYLIVIFYVITLLALVFYLKHLGGLKFGWYPEAFRKKWKEIARYLSYNSLTSLGSSLTFRLDSVMIPILIGYASNGLYNMVYFMANVINIPTNSVYQISNPIVSQSIENQDFAHIEEVYKKSSTNLFLVGSYLFVGMMVCLPDLFQLSVKPESFAGGMSIFLFLGLGKIVDMITGTNGAIIAYSAYYRYNLWFILLLGLSNIVLNYILITDYGVSGAAMATFISISIYNILKLFLIYFKFNMHPFSIATVKIGILFSIILIIASYLPSVDSHILNIVYKGGLITLLSTLGAYYLHISEEANNIIDNLISKKNNSPH
ncbi:MAG: polysaccharide biosynthesis C-terminal domain-containing protein [Lewinellaceae bacterium]|nr:polysaccharide biosynthesis C-terminal domain-containing protein [Lewinellaceae bacterium]